MFEKVKYEILLQAETPIASHRETFGNHATHEHRTVRLPDGSFASVLAVNADGARHGLREASAWAYLDAAGLVGEKVLSEAVLRLLFNGGVLGGRGDGTKVKLSEYHELCDLIPPIGLLGGCVNNRCVESRTITEDVLLICEESRTMIPEWMLERAGKLSSSRVHIEEHQRVRMDATLQPTPTTMLTEAASTKLRERLLQSEHAHEKNDALERQENKSSMLPRTFEAVCMGSFFKWTVYFTCTSALEVDTCQAMLGAFLTNARVGGKRATGFGRIRAVAMNQVSINKAQDTLQSVSLGPRVGETFRSHVRNRREKIRTFLSGVDA